MTGSLYRTEAEIAREVLGKGRTEEWRGIAVILEREGLPKVNPLTGGRYWPAVKAWLDVWERVPMIAGASPRREGRETWPSRSKRPESIVEPAKADVIAITGPRRPTT